MGHTENNKNKITRTCKKCSNESFDPFFEDNVWVYECSSCHHIWEEGTNTDTLESIRYAEKCGDDF